MSINKISLDELKRNWVRMYKEETILHAVRVCLGLYIDKKENEVKRTKNISNDIHKDSGVDNE